jgi:hypothetical protein
VKLKKTTRSDQLSVCLCAGQNCSLVVFVGGAFVQTATMTKKNWLNFELCSRRNNMNRSSSQRDLQQRVPSSPPAFSPLQRTTSSPNAGRARSGTPLADTSGNVFGAGNRLLLESSALVAAPPPGAQSQQQQQQQNVFHRLPLPDPRQQTLRIVAASFLILSLLAAIVCCVLGWIALTQSRA